MGKSMVLYGKVCCGMLWLWYGMAGCCWTLTPTHPKTLLPNPTPTRAAAPQTLFLNVSLLLMCIISHLGIGQAFYWESLEILVQNISLQNLTRFSFWRLLWSDRNHLYSRSDLMCKEAACRQCITGLFSPTSFGRKGRKGGRAASRGAT